MKNFKKLLIACFMTASVIAPTTINNTASATTAETGMIAAMKEYVGMINGILQTSTVGNWQDDNISGNNEEDVKTCKDTAAAWYDKLQTFDTTRDKKMIVNYNPILLNGSEKDKFSAVAGEMILHLNAERLIFDILDFLKNRNVSISNTGLKEVLIPTTNPLFPVEILRMYELDPYVADFDTARSSCVTLENYEDLFNRFITTSAAASNLNKYRAEKEVVKYIREKAEGLSEKRGCTLVTHKTAFQTLIMAALSGATDIAGKSLQEIVNSALEPLFADVFKEGNQKNTIVGWCVQLLREAGLVSGTGYTPTGSGLTITFTQT